MAAKKLSKSGSGAASPDSDHSGTEVENQGGRGPKAAVTATIEAPAEAAYLRDTEWLEQQRRTLLEERAQYTRSAESLAAEAASLMADREPGDVQFDEESGEGDTLAVERDRDLALSAAARQSVDMIDKALARIAEGTYGICVVGGDIIPQERLEAIPEASVCVTHKVQSFG
jgi:RNA polymerase-binding transcription factor DksA